MDYKTLIEQLITKEVLSEDLLDLPPGASEDDLDQIEERLGLPLDSEFKDFLRTWNGANLEVIRSYSVEELQMNNDGLAFADDPSGFVYYLNTNGEVFCEDTDGGDIKSISPSFKGFFFTYIFGKRSHEFMGEDWRQELNDAGIST